MGGVKACGVDACDRPSRSRGWCGHWITVDDDELELLGLVGRILAAGVLPETAFRLARGERVDCITLTPDVATCAGAS